MATQKQKLQKVKEIKTSIKDVINANGGNVGEVFSEYPVVIEEQLGVLGDIKEALIEKGLADETIYPSEYSEAIRNLGGQLKTFLNIVEKLPSFFEKSNLNNIDLTDLGDIISYNDTENVKDFSNAFGVRSYGYNNKITKIPLLNTSKVTNMSNAFNGLINVRELPAFDTSNVTNMSFMFMSDSYSNNKETHEWEIIPLLNTSKVTNMSGMFGQTKITQVPAFDTSNVTNMSSMFKHCIYLETVPAFDTSNVTNMSSMFNRCESLKEVQNLNTSKVTNMSYMFYECINLEEVIFNDTSKVTNVSYIFYRNTELKKVKGLNLISLTSDPTYLFANCSSLTELEIFNIKNNIGFSSSPLTIDSLINVCKECIKQSSSKKLTIGSSNTVKLADVYVKFIDTSQTSIATGEKGDVIVCESTDEGAMTITEYMALKSWTLA